MTELVDLAPAAEQLADVVVDVTDDQLSAPTPCEGRTVGQLLQHLVGLTLAFRAAADKEVGPLTDTSPDEAGWPDAEPGWREALAHQLPALAAAWRDPAAWEGMTRAGGVDLPGQVAGLVALDEIVLHGWDLASATGQGFDCDDATAGALAEFVDGFDTDGTPGMFGPAVTVGADATPFERVLAASGRDPGWAPA
ncbi:TIGR03086 family metal-binding protein [Nocardioides sp. zg-1228]|uniref:TIGR03086 family metal-binding protein n=1 Tax=Nocardioides sp. zg-1228 TaxID=2763008 RepID=UPI0016430E6A|nr:TIGR03086 family metal-binding protein [Nocardioides sp. zg-1228]MBC2933330.1 TIGR03086 family protein [Nocardioides sp. zg-1228]QSF56511.1 TIGR03086 family protein [Nocardioides sp. zg-1228]